MTTPQSPRPALTVCAEEGRFQVGQFYRYTPRTTWCREGIAEVTTYGVMDTYWGSSHNDGSPLNEEERKSAVFLFDKANYEELDRYGGRLSRHRWEQFHPNDCQKITEQHGCYTRWFVKLGAKPDIDTKIDNARKQLEEAEIELRSAKFSVESRTNELNQLVEEKGKL